MALYKKMENMVNGNCTDNATNKVYINPNFNKPISNNYTNSAVMHVNPRFSHYLSNIQPIPHNNVRIYVNPNFMKYKNAADSFVTNTNSIQPTTVTPTTDSLYPRQQQKQEDQYLDTPVPIAKSRYCLVRQNVTKVSGAVAVEKATKTYQVNKYKSIPLNDIKRNLDNAKNATIKQSMAPSCSKPNYVMSIDKKYLGSATSNTSRSQFKLVNRDIEPIAKNYKIKTKTHIEIRKKVEISQIKLKKMKGNLKKNNIPCPTYRKFGKCLRKLRGNCEFLHDKRHISICRKFIKGLCHDKECLLSHDLTAKKMPTCYFYLQGTCTKPDCPYLHVKLSEKVKICPDFLKGYCEKGSKCLQRHMQPKSQVKGSVVRQSSLTSKRKYNKIKSNNSDRSNVKVTQGVNRINTDRTENSVVTERNENNTEYRYYQEHKEDVNAAAETCEIIKPMRCKLGTLPSFIQL